jgi:hypothetical protein
MSVLADEEAEDFNQVDEQRHLMNTEIHVVSVFQINKRLE